MSKKVVKCKGCGDTESWHDWAQAPYCSPYCKRTHTEEVKPSFPGKVKRADPERIIHEYGATELSKTREGVRVIQQAAKKYERELLQPGDPLFEKEYGKEIKERNEAMREREQVAEREWKDRGGRSKHTGNWDI